MATCKHCEGTGKCDCFECKYEYAFAVLFRLPEKFYEYSGYGQEQIRKERPEKARAWASTSKEKVRCTICSGKGTIKDDKQDEDRGFEDVSDDK